MTTSKNEEQLVTLRNKMDEQNLILAEALLKRLDLAKEINALKQSSGLPKEDRSREEVILMRVSQVSTSRSENNYLHNIFEEIFNSTKENI